MCTLCRWSTGLALGLMIVVGCHEEDDWKDVNRPNTFWDSCEADHETCAAPFTCLEVEGLTAPVCTQDCEQTSDCPHWTATGHCAGDFQSRCASGKCQYGCE
jgi:hypothetical protein